MTSLPASASTSENAVPHEPAPKHRRCWVMAAPSASVLRGVAGLAQALPCAGRTARPAPSRRAAPRRDAVIAAMIRAVAWLITCGVRGMARSGRREAPGRRPASVICLRGNEVRLLRVRRQQLVRAPLPDRDHRAARSPGRSGRHPTCRSSATGRGRGSACPRGRRPRTRPRAPRRPPRRTRPWRSCSVARRGSGRRRAGRSRAPCS